MGSCSMLYAITLAKRVPPETTMKTRTPRRRARKRKEKAPERERAKGSRSASSSEASAHLLRQSPEELSQRVFRAGRLCGVESSWFFFVFYVGAGLCCWIMPEAFVRNKSEHTSVRNCAQLRSQYAA